MSLILAKIGKWLLGKLLVVGLIVGFAVGVFALYLFLSDEYRIEGEREAQLATAEMLRKEVRAQSEEAFDRLREIGEEMKASQKRLEIANETIELMEGFLTKVEYFFLSDEEKKAHDVKLEKAKQSKELQEELLASLSGERSEKRMMRDALTLKEAELDKEIIHLQRSYSKTVRYINEAWDKVRPYVLTTLILIIAAPIAYKCFFFYALGPFLSSVKPIRFSDERMVKPDVGKSEVSSEVILESEGKIWLKESFLQASDEGMPRKTRFLFDWSIPFTCLASGLVEMVEFSSKAGAHGGRITVSTQDEPNLELAVVDLPDGASMVLRPRHIAGIVSKTGEKVKIKRHWCFSRAQSWITLQFRYFEFIGPCQIVVAGVRGVRAEDLDYSNEYGRRTNQTATIGFTPDLAYGAVRAETFWSYFRGYNPLFDDVFR
ncbi:MAG: hypothetical protein AAGB46_10080, partial [Verrucomicrobiota bacterium]